MVLHTRGRVGRRQLFYKPLSTDLLREAFFCVSFFGGERPYLKMMRSHLNWWHRVLTWGRRVPASALSSWGSIPQLGNKKMYCICLSRHRALSSKCRRGDASPPGEGSIPQLGNKKMYCICLSRHRALPSKCRRGDASPPGEDAISLGEEEIFTGEDAMLQLGNKRRISIYSCYLRSQ